jgi:hypothetical protein
LYKDKKNIYIVVYFFLLQQELITTPVWNLFGRTQAVVEREKANIARDIRAEQREYKKLVTEYTELINETKEQDDRIVVIQANIKDNEKEKAIIDKKNKDTVKGQNNLLKWQQQQVAQPPNESDAVYIKN